MDFFMAFFTHVYGLCWSYVLPVALSHCTAIRRGHVTSLLLLLLSMYVYVCASAHMLQCACGGQGTTFENWISPETLWTQGPSCSCCYLVSSRLADSQANSFFTTQLMVGVLGLPVNITVSGFFYISAFTIWAVSLDIVSWSLLPKPLFILNIHWGI